MFSLKTFMSNPKEQVTSIIRRGGLPKDQLLDAALNLIASEGYHRLTIERLAQRIGCSRTTLYKQADSSKALMGQVALRTAERLSIFLERIPKEQPSTRAELWALVVAYEVFARCNSEDFAMHTLLGLPGLRTILADEDLEGLHGIRQKGLERLTQVFLRARVSGEFSSEVVGPPGELLAGLYAATTGFLQQVALGHASIYTFELENPWESALRSVNIYLDGLGWAPLSSDADYFQLRWQVLVECFPEKLRELGENHIP